MSGPNYSLTTACRMLAAIAYGGVACVVLAVSPRQAWSQAVQQQPPQKSMVIQVAPAPSAMAPAAQPAPPPVPAPVAAAPVENPGLFNEIGKMFKSSTSILPAMPSLGDWGAGSNGLTRLNTIVKGRVACPVAPNGAPDCKVASVKLCQSKGYKDGKSLDTDAAQSCSAKAMIPGRKPEESDCKTENYVTQALCQ